MIEPLGESRDIRDFFPELARRIEGMEPWYQEDSVEAYVRQWASAVPENKATGKAGLDRLLDEGVWESDREPFYEPYLRELKPEDLQDAEIDPESGIITKNGVGIGIVKDGKPVRGFMTPSRKFEVRSLFVQRIGQNDDCSELISRSGVVKTKNRPETHRGHDLPIEEMPIWYQPKEHGLLGDNELIMTSFKWNVHNHGRTMNLKWLAAIVHSNPAWINPQTARKYRLQDGDWIEITAYHSLDLELRSPHLFRDRPVETTPEGRKIAGTMRVPVVIMPGIHPRVLAMSNSCGHWQYTNVAKAKKGRPQGGHVAGCDPKTFRDPDWERNMWWEDESNNQPGKWQPNHGNGWNQNQAMPVAPDPITGQQAFHDTVVTIRKLAP